MKNKILISIVFLLVGVTTAYYLKLFPITLGGNSIMNQVPKLDLEKGDKVNPLSSFNFEEGDYSLYFVFTPEESQELGVSKVLFTKDRDILNIANSSLVGEYTSSDVVTCDSYLYLIEEGVPVLKMGFSIHNSVGGLQSREYGWIEFVDLDRVYDLFSQLSPIYAPIVKI